MDELELEVDQLFDDYFRDFGNLDLDAIVDYFHLPCMFTTPFGVFVFTTASEVDGFWRPRFDDLRKQDFGHTERSEASIKVLTDDTAIASSLATRFGKDGKQIERRGAAFTVRKTEAGWKIVALIHHSPDNVIKIS
ncbi:MAG: nuclear transport factor 2 family protein [Chloroflexi bacterium]|nr:nuclear transport factor 2 family protein [Chloroflexota bacterium]